VSDASVGSEELCALSEWTPEITVLTCQYCGHVPVEMAGAERCSYPASAKVETVPCAGRVDLLHLLKAIEQGADGVLVLACPSGNCHHLSGSERAGIRVAYARDLLVETGLEADRLGYAQLGIGQGETFAALVSEMTERIKSLGPSPMRQTA
jgi:coenzyme F420-reducing hydrogenase delta subunit